MSIDHLPETQPITGQPIGIEQPIALEKKGNSKRQKLIAGGLAALLGSVVGVVGVKAISAGGEHTLPDSDPTPPVTQEYDSPAPVETGTSVDPTEAPSPNATEQAADWFRTMENETPEQFAEHTDAEQFAYLMQTVENRAYDMQLLAEQTGVTLPLITKNMPDQGLLDWQDTFLTIALSSPYNKTHNGLIEVPESEKRKLIDGLSSKDGDNQAVVDLLHDPSYVQLNGPVGVFTDSIYKSQVDSSESYGDTRVIIYTNTLDNNSYTAIFHWVEDSNTGYAGWVSE